MSSPVLLFDISNVHNFKRFAVLSVLLVLLSSFVLSNAFAAQTAEQTLADDEAVYAPTPIAKTKKTKKNSKDFFEAHKNAPKKAATVQADDLMNAMRQDIQAPVQPPVQPPAQADAPMLVQPPVPTKSNVKTPLSSQVITPLTADKLSPKTEIIKDANDEFPPVTSRAVPAIAPAEAKQEAPPVVVKSEAKKEEPKVEPAKNTAPLLSDLADAPDGVMDSKTSDVKPSDSKPTEAEKPIMAAPKAPEPPQDVKPSEPKAADGFAKSRSLFSSPGDTKRKPGIAKIKPASVSQNAAPPVAPELYKDAEPSSLPPVPAVAAVAPSASLNPEPMIKPVDTSANAAPEKKGIWGAPDPELTKGKVLFSQSADGTIENNIEPSVPASAVKPAALDAAPEVKTTEITAPDELANDSNESAQPVAETQKPVPTPVPVVTSYVPVNGSMVHGSCGAVNGVGLSEKPVNNLCTQGTPSAVSGAGPWNWECNGSNGGTNAKCFATLQINGECGMANGSQSASPPPGKLCLSGKASKISGNGPWQWNCFGDNGGATAQCVAYTLVSGRCGAANNVATRNPPVSGLCAAGHETAVIGDGPWSWSCTGSGESTTVNCNAPIARDGACGDANNVGYSSKPQTDLCAIGAASAVRGTGPWDWSCEGENGGNAVTCSSPLSRNAACGPAHGVGVNNVPSEGLCVSGNASAVSGTGPWNWTCLGENGGAMVNCMAPKKSDGQCGPAHQSGFADAPQTGLCAVGQPSAVSGTGPWQWSCQGAGSGITSNCIAQPLTHAGCGAAHGVSVTSAPTSSLCTLGTPTTVIGSGPFMWSCQGVNGGSTINCMAPLQINGACGSADGTPTLTAPSRNLCASGQASAVSGTDSFIWTCQGSGSGLSTTCLAPVLSTQAQTPAAPIVPVADVAPSTSTEATGKSAKDCAPSIKRWTITCQQGGYPSNYTGVIVGETQIVCPSNVERGVWLSNSCSPATNSAPVSPSPGKLVTPQLPSAARSPAQITDVLPEIAPMSARDLAPPNNGANNGANNASNNNTPRKLFTPHFKRGAAVQDTPQAVADSGTSLAFAPSSEGLDASSINTLDSLVSDMRGDDKGIVTLNAYAAIPASGDQQEARRLALARALSVRSYLMRKAIPSSRIDVRAVGPAGDTRGDDRVDIKIK